MTRCQDIFGKPACLGWEVWTDDLRGAFQLKESMTDTAGCILCRKQLQDNWFFSISHREGEVLYEPTKAPAASGPAQLQTQAKGNKDATKDIKGQNLAVEQEDGWKGSHDLQ